MKFFVSDSVVPYQNSLSIPKNTKGFTNLMRYYFIFLHVVLGIDFGFIRFESFIKNVFMKVLTLLLGITYVGAVVYAFFSVADKMPLTEYWCFFDVLIYLAYVLTLMSSTYTLKNYFADLHKFDSDIAVDTTTYKSDYKLTIFFVFLINYKIFETVLYCAFTEYCILPYGIRFIHNMTAVASNFVNIMNFFIYYTAYGRLKKFILYVDKYNVVNSQRLYKTIAEVIEKVKTSFDVMFLLCLVYGMVDIVTTIYLDFIDEKSKLSDLARICGLNIQIAQELVIMFAPTLSAGFLSTQSDTLKLKLHDLLLTADCKQKKDIKRFLAYVEARPLKFTICKIAPLDWTLPITVLNISITYLIVMLQFTP